MIAPNTINSEPRFIRDVPLHQLQISELNPRTHRNPERIKEISRLMTQHGFDPAYALKVVAQDDGYEVFAGGNRLLAAQAAELETVPVYVYENLNRTEIWRLAYLDNEEAGQFSEINPVDVWCDYARRIDDGWTQAEMSRSLGVSQPLVSIRVRLSQVLVLHQAVLDGKFDEGHCQEILAIYKTSNNLDAWLTQEQVFQAILKDLFSKHTGISAGIRPTVKQVRQNVKRWTSLLKAAETACESLSDNEWKRRFVEKLAESNIRTQAGVNQVLSEVFAERQRNENKAAERLRDQADQRQREAQRLEREQQHLAFLKAQTDKVRHGDARTVIQHAPAAFHLLLTDPPYGINFQSQRRVATPRKHPIAGDTLEEAAELLQTVLDAAVPHMADDATCLIFTGWKYEPEFRKVIQAAGLEIKGSLVWVKPNHGSGDLAGSFAPQHERILHAVKGKPTLRKRIPDVLYGKETPASDHPMEKPRDLLRQMIEAVTDPGQIVVDPFCGSGSTLLEAYSLDREFFGCELDDTWHQVATEAVFHMARQQKEV